MRLTKALVDAILSQNDACFGLISTAEDTLSVLRNCGRADRADLLSLRIATARTAANKLAGLLIAGNKPPKSGK